MTRNGRWLRGLGVLFGVQLALSGCASPAETAGQEAAAAADNSMQAIKDARLARESLPGQAVYQAA
ncbi:MAG: hypothetical protein AB8B93_13065, partial [Pseudomonadales bacterium]